MSDALFADCGELLFDGPPLESAKGVIILIHGRGASAESILSLYPALRAPQLAAIAPQADSGTWYPYSFLSPLAQNEPHLSIALHRVASIVENLLARHVPSERIAILGFSQGACLAAEFAATHARRFGAIIGLSGGLIGPSVETERYSGNFDGTPVLLGSSDPDPHVPWERVQETESVLTSLGAVVDLRRYARAPHSVNEDEVIACRNLLKTLEV